MLLFPVRAFVCWSGCSVFISWSSSQIWNRGQPRRWVATHHCNLSNLFASSYLMQRTRVPRMQRRPSWSFTNNVGHSLRTPLFVVVVTVLVLQVLKFLPVTGSPVLVQTTVIPCLVEPTLWDSHAKHFPATSIARSVTFMVSVLLFAGVFVMFYHLSR